MLNDNNIFRTILGLSVITMLGVVVTLCPGTVSADTCIWSPSGGTAAGQQDGPGTWNSTSAVWFNERLGAIVDWSNSGSNTAVFGVGSGTAGTVTVSGSIVANSLVFNPTGSGFYTLSGGTINLSGASPNITANYSATIASVLSGTGGLIVSGTSDLILTGSNTYSGTTNVGAGTLQIGDGVNSGSLLSSGSININSGALLVYSETKTQSIGNSLNGSGTLVFNGASPTVFSLTGANTGFTGTMDISNCAVSITGTSTSAHAPRSATINVAPGGELLLSGGSCFSGSVISGTGTGSQTGAINLAQNAMYEGPITLAGSATIGAQTSSGTISGNISGPYQLTLIASTSSGGGPLFLSGSNSYGSTLISAGIVTLGSSNSLGSGGLIVGSGGSLQLYGYNASVANLSSGATGGVIMNGQFSSTPSVLTVGTDSTSTTFGGALVDGGSVSLGLTKTGTGTLTLSGISLYTGPTTVSAGVLSLAGSAIVFSSSLSLNGGELSSAPGAGGWTGSPVIAGTGSHTISPGGDGAIGPLGVGLLNINHLTTMRFDIASTSSYDRINDVGSFLFSGSGAATVDVPSGLATGTYQLITYGSSASTSLADLSLGLIGGGTVPGNYKLQLTSSALDLLINGNTYNNSVLASSTNSLAFGRVMLNNVPTSSVAISLSSGTSQTGFNVSTTGGATASASGNSPGSIPPSGSVLIGLANLTGSYSGSVSVQNSGDDGTGTGPGSAGAGEGDAQNPLTIGVTGTVVANRVVTSTSASSLIHIGQSVSQGIVLSTTGADSQYTRVTVLNARPDSNGISVIGGANPTFNSPSVSDSRTLSGAPTAAGILNGTVTLTTSGEGLAGESPINVPVNYSIQVFSGSGNWIASSGSWGSASNWTDSIGSGVHAVPGTFAGFSDSVTFSGTGAAISVNLTGVSPNLSALTFGNGNYTLSNGSLTLSSGGTASVTVTSGSQTINTPIALASNTNFAVNGGALQLNSAISGSSAFTISQGLLVLGGGTGGLTTFSGPTMISAGTLQLGSGTALVNSPVTVNSGEFNVQGVNAAIQSLSGNGAVLLSSGTLGVSGNNVNTTFSGAIRGSGLFSKSGTGSLTLGGSSSYAGSTTISNGILSLANPTGSALGSSTLIINGGELTSAPGSGGSTGGAVVAGIGPHTISPGGDGTIGSLGVGSLTINSLTTMRFDIASTSSLDQIIDSGAFAFSGSGAASLDVPSGLPGGTYQLVSCLSTSSVSTADLSLGLIGGGTVPGNYKLQLTSTALDLISRNTYNNSVLAASTSSVALGRVMLNNVPTSTVAISLSSGTSQTGFSFTTTGSITASASGNSPGSIPPSGSVSIGLPNLTGSYSGSVSVQNSGDDGTGTGPGSAGAGEGNAQNPLTIGVTGTVVANRVVNSTSASFGLLHIGQNVVSQGIVLTTTGADSQYTRVTVLNGGTDANGLSVSGGANPTFNSPSVSDSRSLGGALNTAGIISGTVTLTTSGEGLAGESPINVPVNYSVQVFSGSGNWTGSSGSWGSYANWTDSNGSGVQAAPGTFAGFTNTDTANFSGSGATAIDLTGVNPSLAALSFSNTNYTLSNGSLTLNSSGMASVTVTSGTQTINTPITLASNTNFAIGGGSLVLNSTVSGSGAFTLSGTGGLTLPESNSLTTTGPITVAQGTLNAPLGFSHAGGGILVASGGTLQAGLSVVRAVTGNGTITATNQLIIGNASQSGQFNQGGAPGVGGTLNVGSNAVILLSSDTAILGSQTNIGPGGSVTTLDGAQLGNPTSVDSTKVLTATGSATINGNFINNGVVNGPTAAGQTLLFTQAVVGAGSTTGNIEYAGSYRPSNSPNIVSVQNILLDPTSTLEMEIGGTVPGIGYDQLDISGVAQLNGTLELSYLDGFEPAAGETFQLFDGDTTGSFSQVELPALPSGLQWNTSDLATGTLSVAPEPGTFVLLIVAAVGATVVAWQRRFTARRCNTKA